MIRKYLIVAALVVAVAAPAFAATKYMVSQDQTTHKCYVVTKIGKNGMQIGTATYATKVLYQVSEIVTRTELPKAARV
jgi:uncharacterized membrane protein